MPVGRQQFLTTRMILGVPPYETLNEPVYHGRRR